MFCVHQHAGDFQLGCTCYCKVLCTVRSSSYAPATLNPKHETKKDMSGNVPQQCFALYKAIHVGEVMIGSGNPPFCVLLCLVIATFLTTLAELS